jgi:hypothetical protein
MGMILHDWNIDTKMILLKKVFANLVCVKSALDVHVNHPTIWIQGAQQGFEIVDLGGGFGDFPTTGVAPLGVSARLKPHRQRRNV